MDFQALEKLGFTQNEIRLYLFLVENGKTSITILAKRLSLARSTVYSVVDSLEKRSFIRRERTKGTTVCHVHRLEVFKDIIEEEEEALRKRKVMVQDITHELKSLMKLQGFSGPKIEFYEGKARVERFLYENLPLWTASLQKLHTSTWGYQDHTFVELYQKWIKHCWRVLHQEGGIQGKLLSNRSDIERNLKGKILRREVRVLDEEIQFESSFWIMGEYVVLIMTRKSPVYAVQIHDTLLSANLRLVFRNMYDRSAAVS